MKVTKADRLSSLQLCPVPCRQECGVVDVISPVVFSPLPARVWGGWCHLSSGVQSLANKSVGWLRVSFWMPILWLQGWSRDVQTQAAHSVCLLSHPLSFLCGFLTLWPTFLTDVTVQLAFLIGVTLQLAFLIDVTLQMAFLSGVTLQLAFLIGVTLQPPFSLMWPCDWPYSVLWPYNQPFSLMWPYYWPFFKTDVTLLLAFLTDTTLETDFLTDVTLQLAFLTDEMSRSVKVAR